MSKATLAALDQAIIEYRNNPNKETRQALTEAETIHVDDLFRREREEALTGRIIKNDE